MYSSNLFLIVDRQWVFCKYRDYVIVRLWDEDITKQYYYVLQQQDMDSISIQALFPVTDEAKQMLVGFDLIQKDFVHELALGRIPEFNQLNQLTPKDFDKLVYLCLSPGDQHDVLIHRKLYKMGNYTWCYIPGQNLIYSYQCDGERILPWLSRMFHITHESITPVDTFNYGGGDHNAERILREHHERFNKQVTL